MSDILVARQAEVFLGDPERFYLLIDEPLLPVGNGLDYWQQVFQTLGDLHAVLKSAGQEVEPYVLFGGILLSTRKFVESQKGKLYGAKLKNYQQLFRLPRTDQQVAVLLGVDVASVPNLMGLFGLRKDPDGYWRPLHSPEMDELRELSLIIDTVSQWHLDHELREAVFADVLSHPVGDRAKHAEPSIRRVVREKNEE